MLFLARLLLISLLSSISVQSVAKPPGSFSQAKRIAVKLFSDRRETLYCGCSYDTNDVIDLTSCHMEGADDVKRAHRVEWEHMMPAENIGREFDCWHITLCTENDKPYKGRRCCEKINAKFRQAESELYNLWPSVGLINQIRSNYEYAWLDSKRDSYGCDFKVEVKARKVEPSDAVKGIVARANLFMVYKHKVKISALQKKLFELWHNTYPVSDWEKEWAGRVAEIEGYTNPYITGKGIPQYIYE